MLDWWRLLLLAGLVAVPVLVAALLELRASRRRRDRLLPSRWPPAEPAWTETLGTDRGRAFAFDENLHRADTEWQPPGHGTG